jgi:hypothetical protein
MDRFEGSRLKVERAKKHITDLHSALIVFQKGDFYRIWVDEDLETGLHHLKLSTIRQPPIEIALMIGDAVHNLRTALDLLTSEVIWERLKIRTKTSRDNFPIRKLADQVAGTIKSGLIQQADPSVGDLILNTIKPYEGGNDGLVALHNLDLVDKHRLLIPWVQITAIWGIDLEDSKGNIFNALDLAVDGTTIHTPISSSGKMTIKGYGEASSLVLFGKDLPVENKHIVPTLTQFSKLVSEIVDIFEDHYA